MHVYLQNASYRHIYVLCEVKSEFVVMHSAHAYPKNFSLHKKKYVFANFLAIKRTALVLNA